jgi:tetratricopeptide (TPR) repeat protein
MGQKRSRNRGRKESQNIQSQYVGADSDFSDSDQRRERRRRKRKLKGWLTLKPLRKNLSFPIQFLIGALLTISIGLAAAFFFKQEITELTEPSRGEKVNAALVAFENSPSSSTLETLLKLEDQNHPLPITALNALAKHYRTHKKPDKELECYQKIVKQKPNDIEMNRKIVQLLGKKRNTSDQQFKLIAVYLKNILAEVPYDQQANVDYGLLLVREKKVDEAIRCFERLEGPSRWLLVQALLSQKSKDDAKREAESLMHQFADQILSSQQGNIPAPVWRVFVNASITCEKMTDALNVLDEYQRLHGETEDLIRSKADLFTQTAMLTRKIDNEEHRMEELEVLEEIDQTEGNSSFTLNRYYQLGLEPHLESGQLARQRLYRSLAHHEYSSAIFYFLGDFYIKESQPEDAIRNWELAILSDPEIRKITTIRALNNLAWTLTWNENPRLDKALKMINRALKVNPTEAHFLDTRGHIYARMGRFEEALVDLHQALLKMPTSGKLHHTLSEIYSLKNITELAKSHAEKAKKFGKGEEYNSIHGTGSKLIEAAPSPKE